MKRITGLFLSMALIFAVILPGMNVNAAGGFGVTGVKSFTVSGNDKMINTSTMSAKNAVDALVTLLNEAETLPVAPQSAAETAKIALTHDNGGTSEYVILSDNGGMYAKSGGKTLKISQADFHVVMNAFGTSLYKYRAMPQISGNWGSTGIGESVTMENNTYSFKKLDNQYYRPYYESTAIPKAISGDGKWESLSFTLKPESYTVSVYGGKSTPAFTGTFEKAGEYVSKNKGTPHTVKIEAKYADTVNSMYRGSITYVFTVAAEKAPDLELEGASTYPGEVAVLKVNNYNGSDKITFTSELNFTPKFFDNGDGGMIALLPVSYFTAVGEHKITLSCGNKSQSWTVSVKDKKFQIQNLTVDNSTASSTINSDKANKEYEQYIAPLRQVADSEKYWDGFTWPVTGRVSTEFGMIRYVNGAPTSSRHGAIDFAVPKGTPVKATAGGRVLYAGFLQLTGNTVLIEHGYGLKSWYYHMDSLDVKTGDMVKMSQQIGKVGSTGFSTGAHLHFGMSVNNVFINPSTVIDTDLIKKQ